MNITAPSEPCDNVMIPSKITCVIAENFSTHKHNILSSGLLGTSAAEMAFTISLPRLSERDGYNY
jgi:hypothetical protein